MIAAGDDLEFMIVSLCFGCWVLPMFVIGITYGIARSITLAKAMHGVSGDGLHCAKCKFDLRGNSGWDCPECGTHLDQPVSMAWPRGGIIVKQLNPPMPRAMAVLLYIVGGFVPAVIAVSILGMILPINYQTEVSVNLYPDVAVSANTPYSPEANFSATRKRSWLGNGGFESLRFNSSSGIYRWVLPGSSDATLTNQAEDIWSQLIQVEGWMPANIDPEPYHNEFVALFVLVGSDRLAEAERQASLFEFNRFHYTEPSFHPLYTVLAVVLVLGAIVLLCRWAIRESMRNEKAFADKVQLVRQRFDSIVQRNQKQMQGSR